MSSHRPTVHETRAVGCPVCFAAPGDLCAKPTGGERPTHHRARVQRYRDGLFAPQPPIRKRCARDSDWCDGVICRENGIDCPNATSTPQQGHDPAQTRGSDTDA